MNENLKRAIELIEAEYPYGIIRVYRQYANYSYIEIEREGLPAISLEHDHFNDTIKKL